MPSYIVVAVLVIAALAASPLCGSLMVKLTCDNGICAHINEGNNRVIAVVLWSIVSMFVLVGMACFAVMGYYAVFFYLAWRIVRPK